MMESQYKYFLHLQKKKKVALQIKKIWTIRTHNYLFTYAKFYYANRLVF